MTTPHKATPEQWARLEMRQLGGNDLVCAALELRDRLAALEVTQHVHADASRMSDAEREQFYAELAKPARVEALDAAANSKPTPNPSQIRSSAPAGDLMQSVGAAICSIADCGDTPSNWAPEARAAILAVAAWLGHRKPGALQWAALLREEVERHG